MSNSGFDYLGRPANHQNERMEMNNSGDVLKKFNGTPTSWPTHSKVQFNGQSHSNQQIDVNNVQSNIGKAFKNLF